MLNNPVNTTDPSGHRGVCPGDIIPSDDGACGGGVDYGAPPVTPTIPPDPIPQLPCNGLSSGVGAVYNTTCKNINQAAQILYNPNATLGQKLGAGYYIGVVGGSHAGLVLGLAGIACGLMQCYLAAVPLFTRLATINPDSINVSIGNYIDQGVGYTQVAETYNMTYLQVPQPVYEMLNDLGLWENINQQFINNQAEQLKTFFVTQVGPLGNGTINEMEWIMDNGYAQNNSVWSTFVSIFVPNP